MHLLFVICVLLGFVFKLVSTLPNPKAPEWIAWAFWLAAAVIWSVPQFSGV